MYVCMYVQRRVSSRHKPYILITHASRLKPSLILAFVVALAQIPHAPPTYLQYSTSTIHHPRSHPRPSMPHAMPCHAHAMLVPWPPYLPQSNSPPLALPVPDPVLVPVAVPALEQRGSPWQLRKTGLASHPISFHPLHPLYSTLTPSPPPPRRLRGCH